MIHVGRCHVGEGEVDVWVCHQNLEGVVQLCDGDADRSQGLHLIKAASTRALDPVLPEPFLEQIPIFIRHLGEVRVERQFQRMLAQQASAEGVNGAEEGAVEIVQRAFMARVRFTSPFRVTHARLERHFKALAEFVRCLTSEGDRSDLLHLRSTRD